MSVFSSTFLFYRVFGSSNTKKNTICKEIVPKSFYKKIEINKIKPLFLDLFSSRFWAFLGEGSSKTPLKTSENKSDPGPFLASDPSAHHGGHRFVFGGSCGAHRAPLLHDTPAPFHEPSRSSSYDIASISSV
jgi:hypothetical protein